MKRFYSCTINFNYLCWCLLLAMAFHSVAWGGGEPVGSPTVKQRQDCELFVTKGIVKRNAGADAEAETFFKDALQQWQDCYLAHEQLAWLNERKGDLKASIDSLLKAKHSSPDDRWSFLNFHIGEIGAGLFVFQHVKTLR